jgi:hypothetical protein
MPVGMRISFVFVCFLLPSFLLAMNQLGNLTLMSDPLSTTPMQFCEERWKNRLQYYAPVFHKFAATEVDPHNREKILVVHVGKTGGATLVYTLFGGQTNFHVQELHIHALTEEMVNKFEIILLSLRSPVDRLISAYYFSHPLSENSSVTREHLKQTTKEGNHQFYAAFFTLQEYATALLLENSLGAFARQGAGHMPIDTCSYLGGTLEMLKKHKKVFVINTESLLMDLNLVSKELHWNYSFVENKKGTSIHVHAGGSREVSMVTFMQLSGFLELNGENFIYNTLRATFDCKTGRD